MPVPETWCLSTVATLPRSLTSPSTGRRESTKQTKGFSESSADLSRLTVFCRLAPQGGDPGRECLWRQPGESLLPPKARSVKASEGNGRKEGEEGGETAWQIHTLYQSELDDRTLRSPPQESNAFLVLRFLKCPPVGL